HSVALGNQAGREFDLHWHSLRESLAGDADAGFWERAVPLSILHVRSRGLAPADQLLHTIVHGIRWNEEPTIRWIADAMAILQTSADALDWEVFLAEARERSLQLHVRHGLGYLREAFHAPIPAAARKALERAPLPGPERVESDV